MRKKGIASGTSPIWLALTIATLSKAGAGTVPPPTPWVPPANATLMNHKPVLDSSGKIIPWTTGADPFGELYDLAWAYWNTGFPRDPDSGLPMWYLYASYHPGQPRGNLWPSTPASTSLFMAEAAVAQFAYTGNGSAVTELAVPFSLYVLANGTTPASWLWGSMPYASADPGALVFRGANSSRFGGHGRGDGLGVIEPDKAADAGHGFVLLANATQGAAVSRQFQLAAVAVADTLAARVRAPPLCNGSRSPWPFRVHADTGEVEEEYTSNVVSALLLFDAIGSEWVDMTTSITLSDGTTLTRAAAWSRARKIALDWQRDGPEVTGRWTACCEDVPIDTTLTNYNAVQPLFAAQYLLTRGVPDAVERTQKIVAFVEKELVFTSNGPKGWQPPQPLPVGWAGLEWGARCVAEQIQYPLKMGIHTGRYAATIGILYEALGGTNATLRDIAHRSFSWASYCTQTSGVNLVGPGELDVWFRIHLGGGLLQMLQAMMLAPTGTPQADHLLLSFPVSLGATVPTSVEYGLGRVAWESSSVPSTDRLRVTFNPQTVTAGGNPLPKRDCGDQRDKEDGDGWWSYDEATGIVIVQHQSARDVVVQAP